MTRILIAEDEKAINDLIKFNLELSNYDCVQVFDGDAAVRCATSYHFDLVILDVMMPGMDGFEVITRLKGAPVIFVTAKGSAADRIKGLRLGADDYITKPFDIVELTERVKAVLRRTKAEDTYFEFDDIRIDFLQKKVFKGNAEVLLKPKEYDLFEALVINRNLALSRDRLITLVWEFDYDGDVRTVDVHIQRLRKKLGLEERLKTVYKTGYRLEI